MGSYLSRGSKILNVRFNNDKSSFVCITESGVRLYNVDPFDLVKFIDIDTIGTIKICGILGTSNKILFMVPGGKKPKYPDSCVLIFDIQQSKVTMQLQCPSTITAVCMRADKIIVSSGTKLCICSFPELNLLMDVDVATNTRGLLEVTPSSNPCHRELLIFPGHRIGSIGILNIRNLRPDHRPKLESLHYLDMELSCMTLNQKGSQAATAYVKDDTIVTWDINFRTKLLQFNCYLEGISSLSFHQKSEYLCCTSDKGNGVIFDVDRWSPHYIYGRLDPFAYFKLPKECASVNAFGTSNTIWAVGFDGTLNGYVYAVDPFPEGIKNYCGYIRMHDLWNLTSIPD